MRTPLFSILGWTELLLDMDLNEKQAEMVKTISFCSQHMLGTFLNQTNSQQPNQPNTLTLTLTHQPQQTNKLSARSQTYKLTNQQTHNKHDWQNYHHRSTYKFKGIINQVLDYSKIENNKVEIESIHFNVAEVIGKTGKPPTPFSSPSPLFFRHWYWVDSL